ncbi:MAG: hypothetical protein N4A49_13380 [Marinifilaceae bacterium]|jgi:hypothetical protein|nr:hypothetical protein [Marinifilaceae bacterium]
MEHIVESLLSKEQAFLVAESIIANNQFEELWEYSISNKKNAWRAAWILDKIYEKNRQIVIAKLPEMVRIIPSLTNNGQIRQFLRILSLEEIEYEIDGDFINFCFDCLMNIESPAAVKVFAMTFLFKFSLIEADLKNELVSVIEHIVIEGSAGVKNRGAKILYAIRNNQNILK